EDLDQQSEVAGITEFETITVMALDYFNQQKVDIAIIEAVLSKQDQMPNEFYQPYDRIKVYVSRVENTSKGPQVFVSRSHPDLLKRLFEQEIPEVY
ncbi:hypothetical protein ACSFCD_12855, partial [Enterococcus faecalis]